MSKDLLIFCVEDDLDIQNLELYTLKANNYEVKGFTNGKELSIVMSLSDPTIVNPSSLISNLKLRKAGVGDFCPIATLTMLNTFKKRGLSIVNFI